MANIKKTFNFRNGVQVDEDNLIVNATGLVGIGTTIPTEALDVRGIAKVVGLVTSKEGFIGIFTAHTSSLGTVALSTSIIGAGVSIKSGIITSNSATGLVTYYGDARFLQGMPTSQWEDTNAGFGVSSIFNTGGTVGIATTNPQFTLQVGDNVNNGEQGVGISSVGHIKVSGIITATTFSGNFNGSVDSSALNATGISTFNNDVVTGAGATVGIGTTVFFGDNIQANFGDQSDLKIYHDSPTDQSVILSSKKISLMSAVGIEIEDEVGKQLADFTKGGASRLFYNANGDATDLKFETTNEGVLVSGGTTTGTLSVTGFTTFSGGVIFQGYSDTISWNPTSNRLFVDEGSDISFGDFAELVIRHEDDESTIKDTRAGVGATLAIGADKLILRNKDGNENYLEATDNGSVKIYNDFIPRLETNGIGVTVYNQLDTTNIVASGVITATTELNSPLVGVGTDNPATDIQVRKVGAAQIRVTSDIDAAVVSVGKEPGAGNGNNAAFRYGNNAVSFPYSNPDALDIINYDTGNINFYLSAANSVSAQGDFHWHKGPNSTRLMTLTNGGKLGIGITLPLHPLHVSGISTFTGNSFFGNNVEIGNNLTIKNNLVVDGSFNSDVTGDLTGNVTGNITSVGLSNLYDAKVTRFLGIGVEASTSVPFKVNSSADTQFSVDTQGDVRVGHDLIVGVGNSIVVGGPSVSSGVDFKDAGGITHRFMVPPTVSAAQRGNLTDLVAGALIWNIDAQKIQVYDGTDWESLH